MPTTSALPTIHREGRPRLALPIPTLVGLAIAVLSVGLIAIFTYRSLETREVAASRVTHTFEVITGLREALAMLNESQAAKRGFLLTTDERYAEPFVRARIALPERLRNLRELTSDDPVQQQRIAEIQALTNETLAELGRTIDLHRSGDTAGALALVRANAPRVAMESIQRLAAAAEADEQALLRQRQDAFQQAVGFSSLVTWGGSALLLVLIVGAGAVMSRDFRIREAQAWLRAGQNALSSRIQGEQRLDVLGHEVLAFLTDYLDAQAGALYIAESGDRLRRFASYALPADAPGALMRAGDTLAGQAVKEKRTLHVTDVPPGYLPVSSGLGQATPAELLVCPATADGAVHGVVELGFLRRVGAAERELLARVAESLAVAIRGSRDRTRLEELLEETQRQAEELQTQQEELRVSNEELEEQGRILRESQARLETQQAELEQINSALEGQTQLLEGQKDELAAAQSALERRAADLERANQYKSEFLANMSHELRTPLNSSLILARLLADNKDGNLTSEQEKFAQTIFAAGNDLLALINDILDLAKIEAGKVELTTEPVPLRHLVETLTRGVQPLAEEKGLRFGSTIEPGVPDRIDTDPQRLGQVLKNLLSNAVKFTERGEVALRVSRSVDGGVAFAIHDTGIGIPEDQQEVIFEAFRQADGSTHRKYGGTGLGLSISRDLARLLGGDIAVQSVPGRGSVFTLTVPVTPAPAPAFAAVVPAPATVPAPSASPESRLELGRGRVRPSASTPPPSTGPIADSTAAGGSGRRLLVVEDDVRFAAILRDLAHELGFVCTVTHTAGEGLEAAFATRPSAILLDVNLPDHSGLGVLDQLKRNPQTRHIPVHVISVADYAQQALELGAVGYALKPVKREQLVEAFKRLEAKLTQQLRRVLVVEDDTRQRESIRALLGAEDVEIVDVATAGEALTHLKTTTFDCMVMDLKLPDLSGYELLERMAAEEDVAFPPVIVYTGRTLSRDEELRLSRFSRSIIVKDARSPERLLDEVTLFLHQVEGSLPADRQRMLKAARARDAAFEGRRILVVEDDARNIFAVSSILEPKGATVEIARNGLEAIAALERRQGQPSTAVDLVLMDIMMPEMDGLTAMREIRKRPAWKKLPIIALTAKAMKDDQDKCLAAGANDYIAKPLDVEKLLSLMRVWMPK
jgi:signal transduction histidine kinase/DNA-binding response OmpR family regulator/CHASE3 domain sensor protein